MKKSLVDRFLEIGKYLYNKGMMKGILEDESGFFKNRKESYESQLINFPDAPTGRAYIGVAKHPLMGNKKGYGFKGVLLQDEDRKLIQCASCGKWTRKITYSHLKKCCGLTAREYKKKYGLYMQTGLVADETSLKLTKVALKNKESWFTAESSARERKKIPKGIKRNLMNGEHNNKHGLCEEQLKEELRTFIHNNRELPGMHNRGHRIYKALVRRYGSCSEGLKNYGLPFRERRGTNLKFVFPDYTVYGYNINQIDGREALYNMMCKKCKLLK